MATPNKTKDSGFKNYFKGVRAEMKKVIWPTRKELMSYTGVVILISTIVAMTVGILDYLIHGALGLII